MMMHFHFMFIIDRTVQCLALVPSSTGLNLRPTDIVFMVTVVYPTITILCMNILCPKPVKSINFNACMLSGRPLE